MTKIYDDNMSNINNSILYYAIVLLILLGLGYSDPSAQGKASSINPKHQAYGKTNYDHTQTIISHFTWCFFLCFCFCPLLQGRGHFERLRLKPEGPDWANSFTVNFSLGLALRSATHLEPPKPTLLWGANKSCIRVSNKDLQKNRLWYCLA